MDPRYPPQPPPPPTGWPVQHAPQAYAPPQYQQPAFTPLAYARDGGYVPTDEEKRYAMYSHLFAAGLALFCCTLVPYPVGALIPLMMTKERGPFLLYHVNQAVWFHMAIAVIVFALSMIGSILSIVCIGYALLAVIPIFWLIASIYGVVVGIQAGSGGWIGYAFAGKYVAESTKRPLFT